MAVSRMFLTKQLTRKDEQGNQQRDLIRIPLTGNLCVIVTTLGLKDSSGKLILERIACSRDRSSRHRVK